MEYCDESETENPDIEKTSEKEAKDEKPSLSKADQIEKLKEIITLLEEYDSDAITKMKELGNIEGFETEIQEIKEKLNVFDFETAGEVVKKLLENII